MTAKDKWPLKGGTTVLEVKATRSDCGQYESVGTGALWPWCVYIATEQMALLVDTEVARLCANLPKLIQLTR